MKPIKPQLPFEEEEEDNEEFSINTITIGDLQIQSKKPIKNPSKLVSHLLKNEEIKKYLNFYDKQRTFSKASYID